MGYLRLGILGPMSMTEMKTLKFSGIFIDISFPGIHFDQDAGNYYVVPHRDSKYGIHPGGYADLDLDGNLIWGTEETDSGMGTRDS